ncbi:MAG: hypothetical protein KC619_20715 [Myxococcales bacterium]|nr:hypothetical protein [Myxococcales bacterium]
MHAPNAHAPVPPRRVAGVLLAIVALTALAVSLTRNGYGIAKTNQLARFQGWRERIEALDRVADTEPERALRGGLAVWREAEASQHTGSLLDVVAAAHIGKRAAAVVHHALDTSSVSEEALVAAQRTLLALGAHPVDRAALAERGRASMTRFAVDELGEGDLRGVVGALEEEARWRRLADPASTRDPDDWLDSAMRAAIGRSEATRHEALALSHAIAARRRR